MSGRGKARAKALFQQLGAAEAAIHGTTPENVHLHEVGALDSIIDIVGAVYALESLGVDRVVASPLNVGSGTIRSAHGLYPVPAPATMRLLKGAPIYSGPQQAEMVTPTGALLVTCYATEFGAIPPMTVSAIGYGAGSRDFPDTPNVLRVLIGEADTKAPPASVVVIEADIDDMNPQLFGVVMDATAGRRRARRVLHGHSDEEEPSGHAADGCGATGRTGASDRDDLPRDDHHRRALPRDVARMPRPRRRSPSRHRSAPCESRWRDATGGSSTPRQNLTIARASRANGTFL